ncbi:MAG: phenylalanine--tRNA ligase subunit beta [Actinobacteria bacterium 13_1_20CM_3_71_11]|nr:MAG: phenylalanine--tRNA ligase subunit beta [Actinobacteria bacterium 13_1_20CM_3_71_11]
MRLPVSWLREWVDVPADGHLLEQALVGAGIEVEEVIDLSSTVDGPLVVGRVTAIEELTGLKKPIRYCQVDVGTTRGIICGARNFAVGDLVVVALPGTVLPGGFAIAARKTYGHVSDGMICSARELGIGDDHSGIIVLPPDSARPGDPARPLVGLDDIVLDVEITPDRGYCLSVRGIARELAYALGVDFRDPALALAAPGATKEPPYPVTVEDPVGCDRFAARLVRGIDPAAPSPTWMRRRLTVAGIRSISLAVDITNYLMLELGQPMHAFDPNRLSGPLVVRRARPGERLTTLDGVARALDPEDMVICDGTGPISLAAVMGGESSEMLPGSVDVLFEAAHWDPVMVSRTARRHRLLSEAAKRWERGVDPQTALVALEKAVRLLTTHAGGELDPRILDLDNVVPPAPVRVPADLPSRVAGVPYPPERVAEILTAIGCTVAGAEVTPPSWRPDLVQPADFAEEVVRLDGYDKVPSVLPVAPPGNGLTPAQRRKRGVGRALAENGYVEVLSYPFVNPAALDALGIPADDPRRTTVRLANPLSDEEPLLRSTLLPPLLQTLRRNLGRGQRDLALYELGSVFRATGAPGRPPLMGVDARPDEADLLAAQRFVPDQPWHVAAVLVGEVEPAGWWGVGRSAGWADAVQAARIVLSAAGVPGYEVRAGANPPWHPGRCAQIVVGGRIVGYAGELHPAVCTALELPRRTSAMELDLDALPLPEVVRAPRISGYPPALIDVALVVDAGTPAAHVESALVDGAGELLEAVRLFDVYASDQLGTGRRSLAYKLTFRAPDRTLTVEEALAARDAAVAVAAERFGAMLRGA